MEDSPKSNIVEINGNKYFFTGKRGTHNTTGERLFEFEPVGERVWVTEKGEILDCYGKKLKQ